MNTLFRETGPMLGINNIVISKNTATVYDPELANVSFGKVVYMKTVDEIAREVYVNQLKESKLYDQINDI